MTSKIVSVAEKFTFQLSAPNFPEDSCIVFSEVSGLDGFGVGEKTFSHDAPANILLLRGIAIEGAFLKWIRLAVNQQGVIQVEPLTLMLTLNGAEKLIAGWTLENAYPIRIQETLHLENILIIILEISCEKLTCIYPAEDKSIGQPMP